MDVVGALEEVLGALEAVEGKAGVRRVRTAEGVRRYHAPVGTPIVDHPSIARVKRVAVAVTGIADVAVIDRPTATATPTHTPHPKLTAPLSPAFRSRFDDVRKNLPESPSDWFDQDRIANWDREWRRMSNGPGHLALEREAAIREMGGVVDKEVAARVKAAGVQKPLDKRTRTRIRNEHSALYHAYDDGKWQYMEDTAVRLFGEGETYDLGNGVTGRYERWTTLDNEQQAKLIETIHAEHPDLAAQRTKIDALMARLVADNSDYKAAYAEALGSVLGQIRPMGGELDAKIDVGTFTIPPKEALGGPNGGVIPYQWRQTGPINIHQIRPVVMDRLAERDFNRLDGGDKKRTIIAIEKLQQGTIPIQEKQRGALAGTYGVVVDNDTRVLIYPHVDGAWHVYAVLPHHDYHEAERRMSARRETGREPGRRPTGYQQRVAAAGPGDGAIVDLTDPPPLLTDDQRDLLRAQTAASMQMAQTRYPTSWIDASNAGKKMIVGQSATGRGFYAHRWDPDEEAQLMLGNDPGETRVAIHEVAHRMEEMLPQVKAAEWAFQWRRTSENGTMRLSGPEVSQAHDEVTKARSAARSRIPALTDAMRSGNVEAVRALRAQVDELNRGVAEAIARYNAVSREVPVLGAREPRHPMLELNPGSKYAENEYAHPDKYVMAYSGKDYGDGPRDNYEILSMGVEGVWTGSWAIWEDPDYRSFIVGLLAAA